jgi:hypothetical protein
MSRSRIRCPGLTPCQHGASVSAHVRACGNEGAILSEMSSAATFASSKREPAVRARSMSAKRSASGWWLRATAAVATAGSAAAAPAGKARPYHCKIPTPTKISEGTGRSLLPPLPLGFRNASASPTGATATPPSAVRRSTSEPEIMPMVAWARFSSTYSMNVFSRPRPDKSSCRSLRPSASRSIRRIDSKSESAQMD